MLFDPGEEQEGRNTYNVVDAKLVSVRFNWPSSAMPRLSRFELRSGVR